MDIFAGSARRGMELALEPAAAAAEAAAASGSGSSNNGSSSSNGNGSGGGGQSGSTVEVESFFSRMTLESLGRAVFDYEFKQGKEDDPVIRVRTRGRRQCGAVVQHVALCVILRSTGANAQCYVAAPVLI